MLVNSANPPAHLLLGSDALKLVERRLAELRAKYDAWRELTLSTDFADESAAANSWALRLGGGAFFSSKKPRHHKTLHSYSGRKRDERSHRPGPKERTQHEAAFAACAPGIFRGRPSSISWGLGERRTSRPDRHRPRGRVGEGDPAGCSASAPFGRQLDPVRSHVQHAPMRDQRSSRCSLT